MRPSVSPYDIVQPACMMLSFRDARFTCHRIGTAPGNLAYVKVNRTLRKRLVR